MKVPYKCWGNFKYLGYPKLSNFLHAITVSFVSFVKPTLAPLLITMFFSFPKGVRNPHSGEERHITSKISP